jgi:CRISPR system Cascade subunit CasA
MNLISDPWLPFRRRDGGVEYGPPAAVANPEFVDLALPRADFQGSAWQFLIGLLQTASAPASRKHWLQMWMEPPSTDDLLARFAPYAGTFELFGDGPRFMQDLDPMEQAKTAPAAGLLIEAPGEQGLKQNTDHFVKRGVGEEMCPHCAGLALLTMQLTGPAGGTGYRVGLRGGGPLTTLVLPHDKEASLWHKLLLNLLSRDRLTYPDPQPDDGRIFPWRLPTRTSEKGSPTLTTTPDDMHPLHGYWAMPNRFRLEVEDEACECRVCGRHDERRIRTMRVTNYGYNYDGSWIHPLTPYRFDPKKSDPPLSQKGQPGGIGYRHWESLVLKDEKDQGNLPAQVVQDYLTTKADTLRFASDTTTVSRQARLWVFGYDLKQNKPRGWYSTEMPLVAVEEEHRDQMLHWVRQLSDAAEKTAWQTRSAVKAAWFNRPGDAKGDFTFVDQRVWEATTGAFYACLKDMPAELPRRAGLPPQIAQRWQQALRDQAMHTFDDLALSGETEAADLKRVIAARGKLRGWLFKGKEMKNLRQAAEQEEAA